MIDTRIKVYIDIWYHLKGTQSASISAFDKATLKFVELYHSPEFKSHDQAIAWAKLNAPEKYYNILNNHLLD